MSGHDWLCRFKHMAVTTDCHELDGCDCALIRHTRADEQERIAQAIEAEHQHFQEWCCFSDQIHARLELDARIARSGGSDE